MLVQVEPSAGAGGGADGVGMPPDKTVTVRDVYPGFNV